MYRVNIFMWRDLKYAKDNFPRIAYYMVYKPLSFEIYNVIKSAIKLKLKTFNPHEEKGKLVIEQDCETREEAEQEKRKISDFLLGSMDKIKGKDTIQKAMANRTIKGLIRKHKDNLVDKFTKDGEVLNFLNKFSIHISWDVEIID